MNDKPDIKPATAVAHLGRDPHKDIGAVNTPVYRATTILFDTVADLEAAERGQYPGLTYGLHGLPTVVDLQSAYAKLEGAHAALAVPSGLAAITLALIGTARAGDHVLVTEETSPLTPDEVERKHYAPGVGFIRGELIQGGDEHTELVRVPG